MDDITTIYPGDKTWPSLLKEIPKKDWPKKLYIRGALPPQDALCIAIVGTRRATSYGREAAREIAFSLARAGIIIVSGMAIGIDSEAHKGCMEAGGKTIAVLGSGVLENVIYPRENRNLARSIVKSGGCLISEYEPDKKPELWTFPQRNRIIAGISKGVVVIEAREKSGALITARLAAEYGRELFALPGSIFQETTRGPHRLLKDGATPVSSPGDILDAFGILPREPAEAMKKISEKEKELLNILTEPLDIDSIIRKSGYQSADVQSLVGLMEIRGIIKKIGNEYYK